MMLRGQCGGQRGRRSSWPPTPLARSPNLLLEITDPFQGNKEVDDDRDSVILVGEVKGGIAPEPGR